MAITRRNYAINQQLASIAVSIVAPSSTQTTRSTVNNLTFYNTGTSARLVTVYMVESGGTADIATVLDTQTIQPSKKWLCVAAIGQTLQPGQSLMAAQDAGTDVNANCSGEDSS